MAVGYDQQGLAQRAAQLGYQGDMTKFPAYLQQNARLAMESLKEQNQGIDTTPQFQTGGVAPQKIGRASCRERV